MLPASFMLFVTLAVQVEAPRIGSSGGDDDCCAKCCFPYVGSLRPRGDAKRERDYDASVDDMVQLWREIVEKFVDEHELYGWHEVACKRPEQGNTLITLQVCGAKYLPLNKELIVHLRDDETGDTCDLGFRASTDGKGRTKEMMRGLVGKDGISVWFKFGVVYFFRPCHGSVWSRF
eukprot:Lankesteria_metandrocarpae@DN3974_c0_g1_i2.p1